MKPRTMLDMAREMDRNPYLRIGDRVREKLRHARSPVLTERLKERGVDLDPDSGVPVAWVRGFRVAHAYWRGASEDGDDPMETARGVWRLLGVPDSGSLPISRRLALEMTENEKLRTEVAERVVAEYSNGSGRIIERHFDVLRQTGLDELKAFIAQYGPGD